MSSVSRAGLIAIAALAIAFAASLAIHEPALRSPFLGDDYRFLLASRDLPFGDFLRACLDPRAGPAQPTLAARTITTDHWRPLNWILFRGLYSLFGDAPFGYHLFSLGIHLSGVVMVWLLARRLVRQTAGVVVATLGFAIHPAGFESISWISAQSSISLPFALGGWLAFIAAVESKERARRRQFHSLAILLIVVALGFRETAVVVFPAMGLWYLLVRHRDHLRRPRTYLPLAPYLTVFVVFVLVSTAFFTAEGGSEGQISVDVSALQRLWFYARQGLVPTTYTGSLALIRLQQGLGIVLLAVPVVALAGRRWLLLALGLGFLASLIPYGLFSVGHGARYFYMPSAFFALTAGAVAAELWPCADQLLRIRLTRAAAAAGLALGVVTVVLIANQRVERWADGDPVREQRWIEDLRRIYPELPDGGTLYVTNLPFTMALFLGYVVEPTVAYLYPEGTHPVQPFFRANLEDVRPWIGPDGRIFVFGEQ